MSEGGSPAAPNAVQGRRDHERRRDARRKESAGSQNEFGVVVHFAAMARIRAGGSVRSR